MQIKPLHEPRLWGGREPAERSVLAQFLSRTGSCCRLIDLQRTNQVRLGKSSIAFNISSGKLRTPNFDLNW
jgi:hypothetical protein